MIHPFVMWPDARLRKPAEDVCAITDEIRGIWADMVDTMDAMPGGGLGLAAVQIGVMRRLAVVDVTPDRTRRILLADPELVAASEAREPGPEASPNLPGVFARVARPKSVTVRYLGPSGAVETRDFDGLEARSVQHQIDHLAGIMYFDRLSRTRRDMLLRRARKARA